MPAPLFFDGQRLPASYANFYIAQRARCSCRRSTIRTTASHWASSPSCSRTGRSSASTPSTSSGLRHAPLPDDPAPRRSRPACFRRLRGEGARRGRAAAATSSYYTVRLDDPKAVFVTRDRFGAVGDGIADDTAALQKAIDAVQETTGEGVVFVPEGRYRLSATLYVWPGIRLIGYGARRPALVLGDRTPGYQDPEKPRYHGLLRRPPAEGRRRSRPTRTPAPSTPRSATSTSRSAPGTRARSACARGTRSTASRRTWSSGSAPVWPASTRAATWPRTSASSAASTASGPARRRRAGSTRCSTPASRASAGPPSASRRPASRSSVRSSGTCRPRSRSRRAGRTTST